MGSEVKSEGRYGSGPGCRVEIDWAIQQTANIKYPIRVHLNQALDASTRRFPRSPRGGHSLPTIRERFSDSLSRSTQCCPTLREGRFQKGMTAHHDFQRCVSSIAAGQRER